MGMFNWLFHERVYSIMNDDHAHLMEILQALRAVVNDDYGAVFDPEERLDHVEMEIKRLIDDSAEHFLREETLMVAYGYPRLAEHRSEHLLLIRSIQTYLSNLVQNQSPITPDIVAYLTEWLTHHIRTADKRLEAYLRTCHGRAEHIGHDVSETTGLAPGHFALSAKNVKLWAKLSFCPTLAVTRGGRHEVQDDDQERTSRRLNRMAAHTQKLAIAEPERHHHPTSNNDYHGWYYGNR
jgi:hemerythrin-like metal-binding protein